METKFNFNSQVCTSRLQSEKLLALGLKKETADMAWHKTDRYSAWEEDVNSYEEWVTEILPLVPSDIDESLIPAWSLHRLMEMTDPWEYKNWIGEDIENDYDNMIQCISFLIDDRRFNKEYLV